MRRGSRGRGNPGPGSVSVAALPAAGPPAYLARGDRFAARMRPMHFFLAHPHAAVYSLAFRLTFSDRRSENMTWTKPEIREIALNMEVTLYVTAR